jgi:hypothetical protein
MKNSDEERESMRKQATFLPALALGAAGAILSATPSFAVPITYTEQVTGASGSLGGTSFANATVTLTMNNDTTNVSGSSPSFFNVQQSLKPLTLNVTGFPTETFTDTTQAAVNQTTSLASPNAGFGDNTAVHGILFTKNASFNTYDLKTSIGPLMGTAIFTFGESFPTTDGSFVLNTVTGQASFTATVSPVPLPTLPAPASLALLVVGLAGLGLIEYRRNS